MSWQKLHWGAGMAETPKWTPAEVWANVASVDGRVFCAYNEIIRRLRDELGDVIDYANEQLGHTGKKGIVKPRGYYVAPSALTDKYLNSVVVGGQTSTEVQHPGEFKNVTQVVIYSIHERIEIQEQYEDSMDRSGLIRGILRRYLTGCIDEQDRPVWRLLEPTGVTALPRQYAEYSGVALYYTMVQTPNLNNWI